MLILGALSIIVGCFLYGWAWFAPLAPAMRGEWWEVGVTAPQGVVIFLLILFSLHALWKSRWEDWDVPIGLAVVWFVFVLFFQSVAGGKV